MVKMTLKNIRGKLFPCKKKQKSDKRTRLVDLKPHSLISSDTHEF